VKSLFKILPVFAFVCPAFVSYADSSNPPIYENFIKVGKKTYELEGLPCTQLGGAKQESNILVFDAVNDDLEYRLAVSLMTRGKDIIAGNYNLMVAEDRDYLATITFYKEDLVYISGAMDATIDYQKDTLHVLNGQSIGLEDSMAEVAPIVVSFKLECIFE